MVGAIYNKICVIGDIIMLNKVIKIVKESATIFLKKDFEVKQKTDETNIVTSADIEVQAFLYENLKLIKPEAGFIGEEDKNDIKEYFWLVDPIDGTTNFSRGMNLSVVSVALIHNNECVLGVVYNPFTDDLYYAERGRGAYNNDNKIVASNKDFKSSLFCTAMSLYRKEFASYCFDIIKDVYYESNDIRRLGSCALELCYLASGKCDLFFEIRVFPWDYAAAGLILQEAGGELCCLGHTALNYFEPVTLIGANTKENFNKLKNIVQKYLNNGIDLK